MQSFIVRFNLKRRCVTYEIDNFFIFFYFCHWQQIPSHMEFMKIHKWVYLTSVMYQEQEKQLSVIYFWVICFWQNLWLMDQGYVKSQFQTTSSLKPIGQNPYHISYLVSWVLGNESLFKWFLSTDQGGLQAHIWKKLQKLWKSSSPELGNKEPQILVWSIDDSRPTNSVQMMILSFSLTFLWKF